MLLRSFPVDILKVDSSITSAVLKDPVTLELIASIQVLGKELNFEIYAEDVSSKEQFEVLAAAGINTFQGALFSTPLTDEKVMEYFQRINYNGTILS
jgi:EAL domain-containing protein (putative c-di-GMP-specific phosphodiesterase class I)